MTNVAMVALATGFIIGLGALVPVSVSASWVLVTSNLLPVSRN